MVDFLFAKFSLVNDTLSGAIISLNGGTVGNRLYIGIESACARTLLQKKVNSTTIKSLFNLYFYAMIKLNAVLMC